MKADHVLAPTTEDELRLLEHRLLCLRDQVLTPADWNALFSSAQLLLPKRREAAPRAVTADFGFGQDNLSLDSRVDRLLAKAGVLSSNKSTTRTLLPADIDLVAFNRSSAGRVLQALLTSFASPSTYEHSRRFSIHQWTPLVRKFYKLSAYLQPPITVSYMLDLCLLAVNSDYDEAIDFLLTVNVAEPLWVRQVLGESARLQMEGRLYSAIDEAIATGEEIDANNKAGEPSPHSDYEDWRSEAEDLVRLSGALALLTVQPAGENAGQLQALLDSVEQPEEPEEQDSDDNDGFRRSGVYWTVERLFEDL